MKPTLNLFAAAEALQNARDHIVMAMGDRINRNNRVDCAMENIRDVMKLLGMEAKTNGN